MITGINHLTQSLCLSTKCSVDTIDLYCQCSLNTLSSHPKALQSGSNNKKATKIEHTEKINWFSSTQIASRYYRKIKWIKLNTSAVILRHLIFKLFVYGSQLRKPDNKTIMPWSSKQTLVGKN